MILLRQIIVLINALRRARDFVAEQQRIESTDCIVGQVYGLKVYAFARKERQRALAVGAPALEIDFCIRHGVNDAPLLLLVL